MEEQLSKALDQFLNENLEKLVLSNPRDREQVFKIQIRRNSSAMPSAKGRN